MAQILASTTPARGHLSPLVPVLDELGRRGHHIALRTLAAEVPSMQARGFDAAPISARSNDRPDRTRQPQQAPRHQANQDELRRPKASPRVKPVGTSLSHQARPPLRL